MHKLTNDIYTDYAATTPIDNEVLNVMRPYFLDIYGNPSSFHSKGLEAKNAMDQARNVISNILNCNSDEIIFTSGGTESINLALKGIAQAYRLKGNHIITSKIEHHAVINTCKFLEKNGFEITYLDVDKYGLVNPNDVQTAITDKTILISIMYANNEIGTIEPIQKIGEIAKLRKVLFHTDACQAAGVLDLNIKNLNVDLLSLNGSKVYGPKGAGILYLRKGVNIEPLIHGGDQEKGIRSGTENIPSIIGFAKALELSQKNKEIENTRLKELSSHLINNLLKIPKTRLNGHPTQRLSNNVNISFMDIEGEAMLLHLDKQGIYASTGSACASKSLEPSHVLSAIGLSYEGAHGSIRFTLGKNTSKADIAKIIQVMPEIVNNLRNISPVNLSMEHFQ
ncbi:MAG: cysteine desulfurase NifS [Nanoarchaeota archaeon]